MQIAAGPLWENPHNLVFTGRFGGPLEQWTAIRAGDDIKTIQGNLGHSSAAFTLDRYGHFTERMKADSAARMEGFMKDVLGL